VRAMLSRRGHLKNNLTVSPRFGAGGEKVSLHDIFTGSLGTAITIIFIAVFTTGCGSEFEILLEEESLTRGIYWIETSGTINKIYQDHSGQKILYTSLNIPLDIDIDTAGEWIFWTEFTGTGYRIMRSEINGNDPVTVYSSDYGPTALSINQTNRMIYWGEYHILNDIWRSGIDTGLLSKVKWFNDLANNFVYSISVHSANGRAYFTANSYYNIGTTLGSGNAGDIYLGETATADSDVQKTSLTGPTADSIPMKGVAAAGAYVYYVTNTSNGGRPKTINRADLNLENSEEWIYLSSTDVANNMDIQKIAVDTANRKIYWTSETDNSIYRADLDQENSGVEKFLQLDSTPAGIAISR